MEDVAGDRRNYEAKVSLLFEHYLIVSELGDLKYRKGKKGSRRDKFFLRTTLFTKLVNRTLNRNARRYS